MRFIGSKILLLSEIDKLIKKHTNGTEKDFLDLFAGTNTVGEFFKKDYKITRCSYEVNILVLQ